MSFQSEKEAAKKGVYTHQWRDIVFANKSQTHPFSPFLYSCLDQSIIYKTFLQLSVLVVQTQSEDSSICDNVTHSLTETCVGRDEIT